MSEALDRYDAHVLANYPAGKSADHRKRLKTVRSHLARLQLLERSLGSLLTRDMALYRNRRLLTQHKDGKSITGETVRKELSLLSRVFTVARAEWGLDTLDNPVTRGVRPPPSVPRMHRIADAQWGRLLRAAREHQQSAHAKVPIEAVLRLAMATTMRLGVARPARRAAAFQEASIKQVRPYRDSQGPAKENRPNAARRRREAVSRYNVVKNAH